MVSSFGSHATPRRGTRPGIEEPGTEAYLREQAFDGFPFNPVPV